MNKVSDNDPPPSAEEIVRDFGSRPGGHAIAGIVSVSRVIELCKELAPKRVLEVGGGIGTLSSAVLAHSQANLEIYEHDSFCLEQLGKVVRPYAGRVSVHNSYYELPDERTYDLIIIDGGKNEREGSFNRFVGAVIASIDDVSVVYIEGNRKSQRWVVLQELWQRFSVRTQRLSDPASPKKGGLEIRCAKSGGFLVRFICYFRAIRRR